MVSYSLLVNRIERIVVEAVLNQYQSFAFPNKPALKFLSNITKEGGYIAEIYRLREIF